MIKSPLEIFVAAALQTLLISSVTLGDYLYNGGVLNDSIDGLPTASIFTVLDNWIDDATLPGWHRHLISDGSAAGVETRFRVDNGSAGGGSLWSLGAFGSSDRALGVTTSTNIPTGHFGARLRNVTQQTFTEFRLEFTGEQWRKGGAGSNTLAFSWSTNATSLITGTWTNVQELDFSSIHPSGVSGPLNGNDTANQRRVLHTFSGAAWEPDASLWLRWTGMDRPNGDDTLAIDDLSFSAIPEPSSFLLSIISAAYTLGRRRR